MNSDTVHSLKEADQAGMKGKKPWVKPSIEKIALESAEIGQQHSLYDGHGHLSHNRS